MDKTLIKKLKKLQEKKKNQNKIILKHDLQRTK